jgi:hypothetical protein
MEINHCTPRFYAAALSGVGARHSRRRNRDSVTLRGCGFVRSRRRNLANRPEFIGRLRRPEHQARLRDHLSSLTVC